jgi:hypothetical protein
MIKKGIKLLAHTKTVNDVFGDVVWEVDSVEVDKVKLTMLGGEGPAARSGYSVQDSISNIEKDISAKKVEIIEGDTAKRLVERYNSNGPSSPGGMEVDY